MTVLHESDTSFFMLSPCKKTGNLFSTVETPVFTTEEQASESAGLSLSNGVNCKQTVYDRQIFIAAQVWKGGNIIAIEYAK